MFKIKSAFLRLNDTILTEIYPLLDRFDKEYQTTIQKKEGEVQQHLDPLFKLQAEIEGKIQKTGLSINSYIYGPGKKNKKNIIEIHNLNVKMTERLSLIYDKMQPFEKFRNKDQSDMKSRTITILSKTSQSEPLIHPIGLYNKSANCAFNALIQFMAHIPGLKEACSLLPQEFDELKHLLQIHLEDEAANKKTSRADSQRMRELMHRIFKDPVTQEELFSSSPYKHEDAYEALMCLLGRIPQQPGRPLYQISPLFSTIITTRRYQSTEVSFDAIPDKLKKTRENPDGRDTYSILDEDNCSRKIDDDCQIILDIKDKGHLPFKTLFREFFINRGIAGSSVSQYLENDNRLHQYKVVEETKEFTFPPKEMLISLKRFYVDQYGTRCKINAPIAVPLTLELPADAVSTHQSARYELDGFVQHRGNTGDRGHYVTYLKINDKWIEYDDTHTKVLSDDQLKVALQNPYFLHYRLTSQTQNPALPPAIRIPSTILLDLAKEAAKCIEIKKQVDALEVFLHSFNNDKLNNEQLRTQFYKTLSEQLINDIHYLVWIHGGLQDIYEYGKKECDPNIRMLRSIQKPFLSRNGSNILEQMLSVHRAHLNIANLSKSVVQLRSFLEMLNNPEISNEELKEAFYQLDQPIDGVRICDKFHALVYQAHLIDEPYYGKKTTDANVRILSEITKPLLSLNGNNLAEQMVHHVQMKANKAKYALLKEQLDAFYHLLQDFSISNKQLQKIFGNLDPDLKEKLCLSVWIADGQKDIPNYGEQAILNDVRCLLRIKEPLLGSTGDIVSQLLALLDQESK
ncbi:MAG TPA: hypothetical protein VLG49_07355 [Rhabdochlamydiaceae bacterium]|nr:hypothetical protein [Rhabdochlamydiaceae bacterium]